MHSSLFMATSVATLFFISTTYATSFCFSLTGAGKDLSGTWTLTQGGSSNNPYGVWENDGKFLYSPWWAIPIWFITASEDTANNANLGELATVMCGVDDPDDFTACNSDTFQAGDFTNNAAVPDTSFKATTGTCAPTPPPVMAPPTPPPVSIPLAADADCFRVQGIWRPAYYPGTDEIIDYNGYYQKTGQTIDDFPVWRRTDGRYNFQVVTTDSQKYWVLIANNWATIANQDVRMLRCDAMEGTTNAITTCTKFYHIQSEAGVCQWNPSISPEDCSSYPTFEGCPSGVSSGAAFSLWDADCSDAVCVDGLEFAPSEHAEAACVRRHEVETEDDVYFLWYDAHLSLWVISMHEASHEAMLFVCHQERVVDCTWTHWVSNPNSEVEYRNETLLLRATKLWQVSNGALDVQTCGVVGEKEEEEGDATPIVIVVALVAVVAIIGAGLVVFLCNKRQKKEVSFTHGETNRLPQDEEEAI